MNVQPLTVSGPSVAMAPPLPLPPVPSLPVMAWTWFPVNVLSLTSAVPSLSIAPPSVPPVPAA